MVTVHTLFRHLLPEQGQRMRFARHPEDFKAKYYREKKDPLFETKMQDILLVNKQVEARKKAPGGFRDYEYKRLGTVSLLCRDKPAYRGGHTAGEQHPKNSGFIKFLKILDKKYPKQDTIRVILDNHSAHKSRETRQLLETMLDGRFGFVFTP